MTSVTNGHRPWPTDVKQGKLPAKSSQTNRGGKIEASGYIFSSCPPIGLHELALLFAFQFYMAGSLLASRRGEHLIVDWLQQRLTGRARTLNRVLVAAVTIIVAGFLCVWAYRMLAWGVERPQTTPALGIPLLVPQAAIMVAAICSFGYALRDLVGAVRALRA